MTDEQRLTSLSSHPTAGPAIRRARGLGGIGGFVLAAMIGFQHGIPFATTIERALAVGLCCNTVVWAAAVLLWKRALVAQAAGIARTARKRAAAGGGRAEV
jgi:hypothetical protein